MTFGWLVGEVIRRVSGKSPGEFLQAEFGGECPDLWFGVPAADLSRLATLVPSGTALDAPGYSDDDVEDALRAANLSGALPFPSPCDVGAWNDQALLRGEVPAANMVATARDLARFYSLVVTGEPPAVAISRATGLWYVVGRGAMGHRLYDHLVGGAHAGARQLRASRRPRRLGLWGH
jgi:CubicO group peptidase (beta-lactamase class C family)